MKPDAAEVRRICGEAHDFAPALGAEGRARLAEAIGAALAEVDPLDLQTRREASGTLIRLFPESRRVLEHLLEMPGGRSSYETQFTLMVYMEGDGGSGEYIEWAVAVLGKYLHNVRRVTARAALQAGDTLGQHFPLHKTFPVLIRAMRSARFIAGRWAAVAALSDLVGRLSDKELRVVRSVAQQLMSVERSSEQRENLAYLIRQTGPTPRRGGRDEIERDLKRELEKMRAKIKELNQEVSGPEPVPAHRSTPSSAARHPHPRSRRGGSGARTPYSRLN